MENIQIKIHQKISKIWSIPHNFIPKVTSIIWDCREINKVYNEKLPLIQHFYAINRYH
jgi:hypothetical protein